MTITVPQSAPIDASLPEQERRAQSAIDSGPGARPAPRDRSLGEGPGGRGGRRIVQEARAIQAPRRGDDRAPVASRARLFGRTIESVLGTGPAG